MKTINKSYLKTQELFHLVVRVHKSDSAFLYFTLEANEGICMYSTLQHVEGDQFRDIAMTSSIEYRSPLEKIIHQLENKMPIQVLQEEVIIDN